MSSSLDNTWGGAIDIDYNATISSSPTDTSGNLTISGVGGNIDIKNNSTLTLESNKAGAVITINSIIEDTTGTGHLVRMVKKMLEE